MCPKPSPRPAWPCWSGWSPGSRPSIIAPIQAAAEPLAPRAALQERVRTMAVGHILPMEQLAEALVRDGYQRAAMVEGRGQFSVRGGLLDVFPPSAPAPYRIDFFDDEMDSIRVFDPETQRSVQDVERIRIGPAREFPPVDDEAALARIQEAVARQVETLQASRCRLRAPKRLAQRARTHLDHLAGRRWAPGLDQV